MASKKEIKLVTSEVVFFEDSHQYFLGEKELQGVTSTLIPKAYPGTYMGIDQETLENAAARGTLMHKVIEGYLNDSTRNTRNQLTGSGILAYTKSLPERQG